MKFLTIYTPTFNRAYCLGRVYDSLRSQSNQNFCWLIIDDGSSDNTVELVKAWKDENIVDIRYKYKPNGGMHTAHNLAYELIDTELNMCIDSDDALIENGIQKIYDFWIKSKREEIGGIYALDVDFGGKLIGLPFPPNVSSFRGWGCKYLIDDHKKVHKIKGDKKFISVTKYLQRYPQIPVFQNEKYYSLYFKQHFIERDYRILLWNEPICRVEYQDDGSSAQMWKQYYRNPQGFRHLRCLIMDMCPIRRVRLVQAIHYVSSSFLSKNYRVFRQRENKGEIFVALLPGILLYLYILWKNRD